MQRNSFTVGRARIRARWYLPLLALAGVTLGVALTGHAGASPSPTDSGEWPRTALHGTEDRDSPLKQINEGNVGGLGLLWSLDLPERSALEANPLEVAGILYVVGGHGVVYAVDALTGQMLWRHDPKANEADPRGARRMYAANRGLAYWKGKVYSCTKDGRMIALDAKSGREIWSTVFLPANTNSTSTGSPRALAGKIVIGTSGSEFGGRGSVTAVDAETGKLAWRFFTVPGDPSKGFEDDTQAMAATTWSGEWWKYGGGGNPWNAITYDEQLGRVYIGTGNAGPWLDKVRSQDGRDNLFTSSIVALDAKTGKYVWHYQTTPNDVWDFDAIADIVLTDLKIDGRDRKVLLQANKNGFFYTIDRVTGKLISAEQYARVNWALRIDPTTGRPVEAPGSRYLKDRIEIYPGLYGAHDWQSMSFNTRTGLAYIPAIRMGSTFIPSAAAEETLHATAGRMMSNQGVDAFPMADQSEGATKRGSLVAWNPQTQQQAWRVDYPSEFNGGTLTTAGNLVFQGLSNGQFNAFAADTGKRLWSFDAKLGIMAAPITYVVKGKQYVSLTVGFGAGGGEGQALGNFGWKYGLQPRRLLTFALGGNAKLPGTTPPEYEIVPLDDPALSLDASKVKAGNLLYDQVCSGCHGANAVANGGAPDVRGSAMGLDRSVLKILLQKAPLLNQGMPQFDDFTDAEIDSLFEYIRFRARESVSTQSKSDAGSPTNP